VDEAPKTGGSYKGIGQSPADRSLGPGVFLAAVSSLYLVGLAGQWLTAPAVLQRLGLWPFLLIQMVLLGIWYLLHARRLRDVGRGSGPAQGIALIHLLAIMLLLMIRVFYMDDAAGGSWMPKSLLLVQQLVTLRDGAGDWLAILGLIACAALFVPPVFSIWAAMQPGRCA
jgi:hypothetical protein